MLGLVTDPADEQRRGRLFHERIRIAIAASISLTIEARVFGLSSSAFRRARTPTPSSFSPRSCAVLNSRPIVTWRNSSSTDRASGCGFHPSLSSGNTVSLAISRILLWRFFQVIVMASS